MWDSPRAANTAAGVLAALALALLAYAGGRVLVESPVFLLKTIVVGGDLDRVERSDIVNALQGRVRGTFFTVDLESVRSLFEDIPWVRRAELRRRWPDCLEVHIEEQVAIARWGPGQGDVEVALIGAGVQGHSHLPVIGHVLPGARLRLFDRDPARAKALAEAARATAGIAEATVHATPQACDMPLRACEACRRADCSEVSTSSIRPLCRPTRR